MVGCGGDEDNGGSQSDIVGSATVSWSLGCGEDEDLLVVCEIYSVSNAYIMTGGPWPCSQNTGKISNIPVGTDRVFILLVVDIDGNPVYRGEKAGIAIQENVLTSVGSIETYTFCPRPIGAIR